MSFIWPFMLVLLLLLIPLAVLFYYRLQQRRQRVAAQYGSLGMMQQAAGRELGRRRHIPPALFLAGLTILTISMARPQAEVTLPRIQGTIMLLFDVSGSMAAEDMEPNRMEAAKAVVQEFVVSQPSTVQLGVVAFSNGGFAVQPPTNDIDSVLGAINRLTPQLGTSLGQGIQASLNAIAFDAGEDPQAINSLDPAVVPTPVPEGTHSPAVIVLISDGENTEGPDPLAAAQAAADRGVRIYTIGIGSAAGVDLEVNGFMVHTRLDEATLQQIAQISGGEYYRAENEEELDAIYRGLIPELVIKAEKTEITGLFAGLGIAALLFGGVFSMLWFNRMP
jgi:Ca-activated chloride channel family protein